MLLCPNFYSCGQFTIFLSPQLQTPGPLGPGSLLLMKLWPDNLHQPEQGRYQYGYQTKYYAEHGKINLPGHFHKHLHCEIAEDEGE